MSWAERSLEAFEQALASSDPTPGGGTAAAVALGQAAALVSMVASLTLQSDRWTDAHEAAEQARNVATEARSHAARLADEDPRDSFAAVSRKWKASVVAGTGRRRPGTHRAPLVDATGESVTRERHASGGGGDGSGRVAIGLWRADARSFAVDSQ